MQVHLSFLVFFAAILTLGHAGKKGQRFTMDFCLWFRRTFKTKFPGCKEEPQNVQSHPVPRLESGYYYGSFYVYNQPPTTPGYPNNPGAMGGGQVPSASYPYQSGAKDRPLAEAESWEGDFYTLTRLQKMVGKQCVEEITLSWKNKRSKKLFSPNCLRMKSLRSIVARKSLIIIESPESRFCVFSSDENELYYKEDDTWRKLEIDYYDVAELFLQPQEINDVLDRILQWERVINVYNGRKDEFTKKMTEEENRHNIEISNIQVLLEQQQELNEKTMNAIKEMREAEDKQHGEEMEKVNKIRDERTKSEARNNENIRHQTKVNELNQKESEENNRLLSSSGHVTNRLKTEELRHKQESQNWKNLLDQEEKRLNLEFMNLKKAGY